MKIHLAGHTFNVRIGRTYNESGPSFPVRRKAPDGAPNVLYIVLEDVGYGWCDTFGGLVETPNITRLADKGLRYTNFHTTALCSPTRACLLTGRNHHANGISELATGHPGYHPRRPRDRAGIGAMLRLNGYNTFATGKWHNTPSEEGGPAGPYDRWPTGPLFGFDHFYGLMGGDNDHWYPELFRDKTPIDQPKTPRYHLSEDLAEQSIQYISNDESVEPDKPWLLYMVLGACFAPHHAPKEWADKYKGKFDMGWDRYREIVLERQKQMGVVEAKAVLSPMMEGTPKWDDLTDDQRRLFARMAEVYAGFLSHADAQIGKVIDFLEKTGDIDNTLIFVLIGDNGSSGEATLDGLFKEVSLAAAGWAFAGNTPFKLCKQYTPSGRTRNPLVVHWPKGIKAKGEVRNQFHHVIDIVPTILQAIGIEQPETINCVAQSPIEGVPLNYSFDDERAPTNRPNRSSGMRVGEGTALKGAARLLSAALFVWAALADRPRADADAGLHAGGHPAFHASPDTGIAPSGLS